MKSDLLHVEYLLFHWIISLWKLVLVEDDVILFFNVQIFKIYYRYFMVAYSSAIMNMRKWLKIIFLSKSFLTAKLESEVLSFLSDVCINVTFFQCSSMDIFIIVYKRNLSYWWNLTGRICSVQCGKTELGGSFYLCLEARCLVGFRKGDTCRETFFT